MVRVGFGVAAHGFGLGGIGGLGGFGEREGLGKVEAIGPGMVGGVEIKGALPRKDAELAGVEKVEGAEEEQTGGEGDPCGKTARGELAGTEGGEGRCGGGEEQEMGTEEGGDGEQAGPVEEALAVRVEEAEEAAEGGGDGGRDVEEQGGIKQADRVDQVEGGGEGGGAALLGPALGESDDEEGIEQVAEESGGGTEDGPPIGGMEQRKQGGVKRGAVERFGGELAVFDLAGEGEVFGGIQLRGKDEGIGKERHGGEQGIGNGEEQENPGSPLQGRSHACE